MSTKISETMIQFGSEDKRDFSKRCRPGDLEFFSVQFPVSFAKAAGLPTVIVTPSDSGLPRFNGHKIVPAVGVVQDISHKGFRLAAWNTGRYRGPAGFNWMAVQETPGKKQNPVDFRMGVVQPKRFKANDGHQEWIVSYRTFPVVQTSFVTATNLYGTENRNAAVVGIATDEHLSGYFLHGRNTDDAPGDCAFYYVSVAKYEEGKAKQELWIEAGGGTGAGYRERGAWESEEVTFKDPFMTPPIVLVSAWDHGPDPYRSAPLVGIARYVTTHGFTLAFRNAGCKRGVGGLTWVALGCSQHCAR